jgi:hypothetical protein
MTRTTIPFHAGDISSLARTLRTQLIARDSVPGHVELLNILARAVGRRNFQQLRAEAQDGAIHQALVAEAAAAPIDARRIERVRRCFAADGRLLRWPAKREDQVLALWVLWARIPSRRDFTEQEISQVLRELHDFGDHALLRRELFESRLVSRTPDCRAYRRIEQPPPGDAAELIRQVLAPV